MINKTANLCSDRSKFTFLVCFWSGLIFPLRHAISSVWCARYASVLRKFSVNSESMHFSNKQLSVHTAKYSANKHRHVNRKMQSCSVVTNTKLQLRETSQNKQNIMSVSSLTVPRDSYNPNECCHRKWRYTIIIKHTLTMWIKQCAIVHSANSEI